MLVYSYTLGCRLNAYESEALVSQLQTKLGFSRTDNPHEADVVLVNTCMVTGKSQARSRKLVRSIRKKTEGLITCAGCVAELNPDELVAAGANLTISMKDREYYADLVAEILFPEKIAVDRKTTSNSIFPDTAPLTLSRTRAFLKVQEGCDHRCSYCVVPLARGLSVSQPRETVLSQVQELIGNGYREIVLTGVDLVSYGRNLYPGKEYHLYDLIDDILKQDDGFRLRLSSTEPMGLDMSFLRKMLKNRICRHVHIPIQSGSDRILDEMGRKYHRSDIEELIKNIHTLRPGTAIGADFIVGFPGETEEDFSESLDLVRNSFISYLHVFPFSPRPGTKAATRDDFVNPEIVKQRSRELRKLGKRSKLNFRRSQIGTSVEVVVEGRTYCGLPIGLTDNYIPLKMPSDSIEGTIRTVLISEENICWDLR